MNYKFRYALIVFINLLTLFFLTLCVSLSEVLSTDSATTLIVLSFLLFLFGLILTVYFDFKMSVYQCRNCDSQFKPDFKAYSFSFRLFSSKYLKCPRCKKRSWCKIVK